MLKPQSVIKIRSGFLFYIEQIFVKFFTSTLITGYAEVKGVQAVRVKCQRSACDKKQQGYWRLQVVQCRDSTALGVRPYNDYRETLFN